MKRILVLCLAACALASPAPAQDSAGKYPPEGVDLSGVWEFETDARGIPTFAHPVPGEKYTPVQSIGNLKGDHTNPILQPWAAAKVKENADLIDAGTAPITSMQRCQPLGVPRFSNTTYNISFLQEKDVITILYEFDHYPRFVYMNTEHPKDMKPRWMGYSVGRWEGDTLVIETAGFNDKTMLDGLGTPHTTQLKVTERYRLIEGGKVLELIYTIDDPGAFTTKWSGRSIYARTDEPMMEFVCPENNRELATASADGVRPPSH